MSYLRDNLIGLINFNLAAGFGSVLILVVLFIILGLKRRGGLVKEEIRKYRN
ncbi:hypothetical protein HYV91_01780 [Candidatus Wolfebacteria bacterium]|nr:hypothetical protein [Candidatus Wolfebacteria bacterium]